MYSAGGGRALRTRCFVLEVTFDSLIAFKVKGAMLPRLHAQAEVEPNSAALRQPPMLRCFMTWHVPHVLLCGLTKPKHLHASQQSALTGFWPLTSSSSSPLSRLGLR